MNGALSPIATSIAASRRPAAGRSIAGGGAGRVRFHYPNRFRNGLGLHACFGHDARAPKAKSDEPAVAEFLRHRLSDAVARLWRLERALDDPALLVEESETLAGVLTYALAVDRCEILTLHAAERGRGVGTALVAAVERIAHDHGCRRLWVLTTTTTSTRCASIIAAASALPISSWCDRGGARKPKPEIPHCGDHDIPIRDELILEKLL